MVQEWVRATGRQKHRGWLIHIRYWDGERTWLDPVSLDMLDGPRPAWSMEYVKPALPK